MASMTKCKIHGLQHSYLVSSSLHKSIYGNITDNKVEEIILTHDDIKMAIFIDSSTLKRFPINEKRELFIEDVDNSSILDELDPIPICIKCFEDYIKR